MKNVVLMVLLSSAVLLGLLPALPASAAIVQVENQTTDRWVWVTVYNSSKKILGGQYCVEPGNRRAATYPDAVGYVRAEVTSGKNCAHPRLADFWKPANGQGSQALWEGRLANLRGSPGNYTFGGFFVKIH